MGRPRFSPSPSETGRAGPTPGAAWVFRAGRHIRSVLSHRHLAVTVAVLAMMLTGPSLKQGWVADDLIHRDLLLTSNLSAVLRDLFVFVSPDKVRPLMESGAAPWWTLGALRVSFFRPLTALTHWLDYRLWPASAVLMHAHSVIWYGAVCGLAALLYRRLMGRTWMAGLAAFLFAVDVVHLGSVGWLANRNGLLAMFFGLLVLLAHDGWRREGRRSGAVLGPLWLAIGMLSAEAAVATCAYLLGHALFLDRGAWPRRLASLVPYAAVLAGWQALYQRLGYGTWGSGFYVDPVREPGPFLTAVVHNGPILLLSQWLGQIPMLYNLLSAPSRRAVWVVALLLTALLGMLLAPLIRGDRVARLWALGMVLAVVPACSISLLSGRLLLFTGLGAMGLMAQFIGGLFARSDWTPARAVWRVPAWGVCLLLVGLHVLLSPIVMPIIAKTPETVQDVIARVTGLDPLVDAGRKEVIVVNAPSPFDFIYLPSTRRLQGQHMFARVRVLAPGYSPVEVTRLDAHTVAVRPEEGYLVPPGRGLGGRRDRQPSVHIAYIYQQLDTFFRSRAFPMVVGQQVMLAGMQVDVTAVTKDGRPLQAQVRLDRVLEDPGVAWLWWDWATGGYAPFVPPEVGRTVRIPGPV